VERPGWGLFKNSFLVIAFGKLMVH
jgi:hypothetical protein